MGIIGILTDFGDRGQHYVSEMKGVGLQINEDIKIVDVSHSITPFSITEAAYVLFTVYNTFPKGSIFVCVIDPGVGSERDIVAVQTTDDYILVGPDNGIFSYFDSRNLIELIIKVTETDFYYPPYAETLKMIKNQQAFSENIHKQAAKIDPFEERDINNEAELKIYPDELSLAISSDSYNHKKNSKNVSATFHGRDIMMPVAAHLSNGLDIFSLGAPKTNLDVIINTEPEITEDKRFIIGKIQYIDDFENIITNIPIFEFEMLIMNNKTSFHLHFRDKEYQIKLSPIFEGNDPENLLLVEGSSGFLEICQNQNKAADTLDAKLDNTFKIEIMGALFSEFTQLH